MICYHYEPVKIKNEASATITAKGPKMSQFPVGTLIGGKQSFTAIRNLQLELDKVTVLRE